ncbi:uncharacterized [Tachysurus ichikawai]
MLLRVSMRPCAARSQPLDKLSLIELVLSTMRAPEQNGKSLAEAREMFHARIFSSCQGEWGRGHGCQSCDMAFVSCEQSPKESRQKV